MSFLWFGPIGGLSAVVNLSELEASCLLVAGGTGLLGPSAQLYASLGRLLAQVMHAGTLFVILDGNEWPDLEGKRPLSEARGEVRDRLRAAAEPALARYGAVYRESAFVLIP